MSLKSKMRERWANHLGFYQKTLEIYDEIEKMMLRWQDEEKDRSLFDIQVIIRNSSETAGVYQLVLRRVDISGEGKEVVVSESMNHQEIAGLQSDVNDKCQKEGLKPIYVKNCNALTVRINFNEED